MKNFDVAFLKEVPLFDQIPDEHLEWLLQVSEIQELADGDALFRKGDPVHHMHLILEGQLNLYMEQNGESKLLSTLKKGDVSGLLPYSRLKTTSGRGVAHTNLTVLSLHQDHFQEMEQQSPEMVQQLVALMTDRVREYTRVQQQQEKLVALGKLSAGLAHELNNPASVIIRSASELLRMHQAVPAQLKGILLRQVKPEQLEQMSSFVASKVKEHATQHLSLLERNALEEDLLDWLEDKGITDGYQLAEVFTDAGFSPEDLDELAAIFEQQDLPEVLPWVANALETEKMIGNIQTASNRISELVNAVKTYSHMDRGQAKEKTSIRSGINSTLTMLNHKLKEKEIRVEKQFEEELPQVEAYVGELNQVWTNLIDNAIDALPENGTLTITAQTEGESLAVHIADNGHGIEPEALDHIFEPFYTTKPVGKGTGLGLDIVHKILLHHNASIHVDSEPGKTVFQLCFPLDANC